MKKIDHVRKMVYIIVGILTIISLVFTIYKKISHAASSNTDNNFIVFEYPLPFGLSSHAGYTNDMQLTPALCSSVLSYSNAEHPSYLTDTVCIREIGVNYCEVYLTTYDSFAAYPSDNRVIHNSWGFYAYRVYYDGTITYSGTGYQFDVNLISVMSALPSDPSTLAFPKDTFILNYPIFSVEDNLSNCFVISDNSTIISGHTKGGVLANYIDSDDLLENSSELPKVDTTPPADPSSNAGWFQKILNGIGRLNQSVQGGVLTIGDYIGAGIEKLEEKLSEVKDSLTGLYGWFTEDFDKNQFQNGLNSIPLISDLNGLKTLVENSGMFNWSDVTPAQSVSFTFDFGGAVLPHSTNTIDFSWYTGNVKTLCNAILCTFLVLGLFVTVVNQIPSIIGGHSGDKGGGSDS